MALRDLFRAPITESAPMVPLSEMAAVSNELEYVRESLAGVEQLVREDVGWRKLGMEQDQAFTRTGLLQIHAACLAAAIKSPLIGRGLRIRRQFVWGRGCEIAARDEDVNAVIQEFIDSPEYRRILGAAQAREEREMDLGVRGEFFLLAVRDLTTRTVRPRLLPAAQISDYIASPDDLTEVRFYRRQWTTRRVNLATGVVETIEQVHWHPVLGYEPPSQERMPTIAGKPVRWDAPIQHCAVNTWTESPYGIPDAFPALDWARGYGEFLENWAKLTRALSRYAWRVTAPGSKAATVRKAVAGAADGVAGTATMSPDATLEAIPKSGATIDAGSGKPLAGMVAAALDVPITMLLADPGVTGARATAETLDRPLELTTGSRQQLWSDWTKQLLTHVIAVAVDDGTLPAEALDATVDVTFPPVEDLSLTERLDAIVKADSLGTLPPLLIVRMALEALGVEDVDEVLDELTDDKGRFIDPRVTAAAAVVQREQDGAPGSQAEEAYR